MCCTFDIWSRKPDIGFKIWLWIFLIVSNINLLPGVLFYSILCILLLRIMVLRLFLLILKAMMPLVNLPLQLLVGKCITFIDQDRGSPKRPPKVVTSWLALHCCSGIIYPRKSLLWTMICICILDYDLGNVLIQVCYKGNFSLSWCSWNK